MSTITEIAPDVYRISTYVPPANLQFNQFLINDDEPLLFHTGLKALFPEVHDAVAKLIAPSQLRWISFSHFESDECGTLNQWLELAPQAQAACSVVGAIVSVDDFASRPARQLGDNESFGTGKHTLKFLQTPHVPHAWECGLLFEETNRVLLCSDLFHQVGDVEAITESDVIDRARETLLHYRGGPLDNYFPYTAHTDATLQRLADLKPIICAPMHGSAYHGNGERALRDYAAMLKETIGGG